MLWISLTNSSTLPNAFHEAMECIQCSTRMMAYYQDQCFDFAGKPEVPFEKGEYDQCTFRNAVWNEADLSACIFNECRFEHCALQLNRIQQTAMRDVVFVACRVFGLRFESLNPIGIALRFEGCQMDHCSFTGLRLRKTEFRNCRMHGVDFTAADLKEATFAQCDLLDARFEQSHLEGADFRTAKNYQFDPNHNFIQNAKFHVWGLPGLLAQFQIQVVDDSQFE